MNPSAINKKSIFIAAILFTTIFLTLYQTVLIVRISGSSMEPAYKDGDLILAMRVFPKVSRGDTVVIERGNTMLIKRVVAVPGDTVYVDGDTISLTETSGKKTVLGIDEYFVAGDNRSESMDSRSEQIGAIKRKEIIGKALF